MKKVVLMLSITGLIGNILSITALSDDSVHELLTDYATLNETIRQYKESIRTTVAQNGYTDYRHSRVCELNARLGLCPFPSSFNPFTHIGRLMDQKPSEKKVKRLQEEKAKIIIQQETRALKEQRTYLLQQLRRAVLRTTFTALQQKPTMALTSEELKHMKALKKYFNDHAMQKLSKQITALHQQINVLEQALFKIKAHQVRLILINHYQHICKHCNTCPKEICISCNACTTHCCCLATTVTVLAHTIAASYTIVQIKEQLTNLYAQKERLEHKRAQINKHIESIWTSFVQQQMTASQQCIAHALQHSHATTVHMINAHEYLIDQFRRILGMPRLKQKIHYTSESRDIMTAALGCTLAIAGIGLLVYELSQ